MIESRIILLSFVIVILNYYYYCEYLINPEKEQSNRKEDLDVWSQIVYIGICVESLILCNGAHFLYDID